MTIRNMTHPVLAEEREWERIVGALIGPNASLVSVSRYIGDSRVYRAGGQIAKIRSSLASRPPGVSSLQDEARVLQHLGQEAVHRSIEGWEALEVRAVDGERLDRVFPGLSLAGRLRILARLLGTLEHLHRLGVAHRDLRLDNVLLDERGALHVVDFDRAAFGNRLSVTIADWTGLGLFGTAASPFWKLALVSLVPKSRGAARRLRRLVSRGRSKIPGAREDEDLALLSRAWMLARTSTANAPGQNLAYYAFTYRHHHFPGERPWHLRWEAMRNAVDFQGKRVVELGCNLGLLSSFAEIHGARAATGVDCDPSIIEGARLVARALQTQAAFEVVNLMTDPSWEARLAGADVVVAMSLLHWLPDPDRLLRFLGEQREIIYEGHDPLPVEVARLKGIGFERVSLVTETERGRFILHGQK